MTLFSSCYLIYLSCIQCIPYKRLTETLRDCFGVSLSQGTIDNILKEASRKSLKAYQTIRDRIEQSKVVGADETGANINGVLKWPWVWQTDKLTNYSESLHQKIIALIKSLTKYKEYVFKFLYDPDVPYDNNASERAVRNIKVKQKVSDMFKSDVGTSTYSQIFNYSNSQKE